MYNNTQRIDKTQEITAKKSDVFMLHIFILCIFAAK